MAKKFGTIAVCMEERIIESFRHQVREKAIKEKRTLSLAAAIRESLLASGYQLDLWRK